MSSIPISYCCAVISKSPTAAAVAPVNRFLPNVKNLHVSGGASVHFRGRDCSWAVTKSAKPNQSSTVNLASVESESAAEIVRRFYAGFNERNLAALEDIISQDCTYEDLVFPQPFVGREAILEFFKKFMDLTSRELQFVIEDISEQDESAVGVTWQLEWRGKAFPFSKGCSFYRCGVVNGRRQILYGRDSVEPTVKPGDAALYAIGAVTRLLEKFPSLADMLQ